MKTIMDACLYQKSRQTIFKINSPILAEKLLSYDSSKAYSTLQTKLKVTANNVGE